MKFLKLMSLALVMAFAVTPAMASETRGTRDEAKAMVEKGVEYLKANGTEKALAAFQDKNGGFVDRDLYIFVVDKEGLTKAHAIKPALVGKSATALKDAKGKAFVEDFIKVKDAGWVEYTWIDPVDNKPKAKESYVVRVGDLLLGTGYYKE